MKEIFSLCFYITSQSISLEEAHNVIVYGLKDFSSSFSLCCMQRLHCLPLQQIENGTNVLIIKLFHFEYNFIAERSLIKMNIRECKIVKGLRRKTRTENEMMMESGAANYFRFGIRKQ